MGPREDAHRNRRSYLDATTAGATTSYTRRRGSNVQDRQHKFPSAVPQDSPSPTSCSVSTLSSRPESPAFDTALYDPKSDSIHIMPHGRQSSLDTQLQDFKTRINSVDPHRSRFLSLARPQSLSFPLILRDGDQEPTGTVEWETSLPTRASSVSSKRLSDKSFDLLAPPPGRRSSHRPRIRSDGPIDIESINSVDADPSESLASQIASSVIRERHAVQRPVTSPHKVQNAVHRRVDDVQNAVQNEHPQWALPTCSPAAFRSSTRSSTASSRASGQGSDEGISRQDRNGYIQKTETNPESLHGYPCPFRRRNPVLFNVRDHELCAKKSFQSIPELKRHIRTSHRKYRTPYNCPRCKNEFGSEHGLNDHLMVPLEAMCDLRQHPATSSGQDGITEDIDKILAGKTAKNSVSSWEEIWQLLFPKDTVALDPEFLPVIEAFETEQQLDDSSAELKSDLCDALRRLLPDQNPEVLFFLSGQVQLVFEQHRAKVNRTCRNNAIGRSTPGDLERCKSNPSRFSLGAGSYSRSSSSNATRARRSHTPPVNVPRTAGSPPASSVYSRRSSSAVSHRSSRSQNSLGGMQVESPRLPFRDWVQGIKFQNGIGGERRDSGLSLLCDVCSADPCQCMSYAEQLSALMTPAVGDGDGQNSNGPDEDNATWAAQYGSSQWLSAAGAPTGSIESEPRAKLRLD